MVEQLCFNLYGKLMYEMVAGKDRAKVLTPEDIVDDPDQLSYKHTFSNFTNDLNSTTGEIMKAITELPYRMRGYDIKADKYSCFLQVQDRDVPGEAFKFKANGKTNLDDYIYYECMGKAKPILKRLLKNGFTIRGVGLSALSFDYKDQLNLFFQEDEKMQRFYLVQDKINNQYGKRTIQKAAVKYDVPGKTHFLERS